MIFNWKLILEVFLVTLFLTFISEIFLPQRFYYIPALIGGFIAGYFLDGNFIDGMVNAGIPVGLVGIIYYLVILNLIYQIALTNMNTELNLQLLNITGYILFFFLFGVLGGLLGFAIRERKLIIDIIR